MRIQFFLGFVVGMTCMIGLYAQDSGQNREGTARPTPPAVLSAVRAGMSRDLVIAGLTKNYDEEVKEDWLLVRGKEGNQDSGRIMFDGNKVAVVLESVGLYDGEQVVHFAKDLFREVYIRARAVQVSGDLGKIMDSRSAQIEIQADNDHLPYPTERQLIVLRFGSDQLNIETSAYHGKPPSVSIERVWQ